MGKIRNQNLMNMPFLFIVDGARTRASGLVAYGGAIETSTDHAGIRTGIASSSSTALKWMTICSHDETGQEHHALVWHNACFAF